MSPVLRSHMAHAWRVAAMATLLVLAVSVVVIGVFDVEVVNRLVRQVDTRLADHLTDYSRLPQTLTPVTTPRPPGDTDIDNAPLFTWVVSSTGKVTAADPAAPALVAGSWSRTGEPTTATLAASSFRLQARALPDGGYLVAGESLAEVNHIQDLLFLGEGVAVPIGLLGLFFGSLFIGVKASAPVEAARRKQLEFTADASHELRTPLTVIDAEVDLALSAPHDAVRYRDALERVSGETGRLRRIVEDLLWLARFDSAPPPPAREPIDVVTICEECAERFRPLATARHQRLSLEERGQETAWVQAPAEWIDRLVAVLVDNACRYTPDGGQIRITVDASSGRVGLAVEDSGPGIAPEERSLLFDRFHRATDEPGGTGLGLAIADSIVRSTGGRWSVGDSTLGGASLQVLWHRPHGRDRGPGRQAGPEVRSPAEVS